MAAPALVGLWMVGAVFVLALVVRRRRFYSVALAGARRVREGWLRAAGERWRRRLGVRRAVAVRVGERRLPPFTAGVLRPVIFLPRALVERGGRGAVEAALAHEMAHVARLDALWLALQNAVQVVWFFNPLARVAAARLGDARERAVDELVVARGAMPPRRYAAGLVAALSLGLAAPAGPPAAPGLGSPDKRRWTVRIEEILNHRPGVRKPVLPTLACALAALLLLPLAAPAGEAPAPPPASEAAPEAPAPPPAPEAPPAPPPASEAAPEAPAPPPAPEAPPAPRAVEMPAPPAATPDFEAEALRAIEAPASPPTPAALPTPASLPTAEAPPTPSSLPAPEAPPTPSTLPPAPAPSPSPAAAPRPSASPVLAPSASPAPAPSAAPVLAPSESPAPAPPPEAVPALANPLPDAEVTSGFGDRRDPRDGRRRPHEGVDLSAPAGTVVHAPAAGRVTVAAERYGDDGRLGRTVVIDHGGGLETLYAHLGSMAVAAGERVEAGEEIGRVGSSGWVTGPHLHLEVRQDGRPVDPAGPIPGLDE